jgi:hypothetical protein
VTATPAAAESSAEAALPPELAGPSTGFEDLDTDRGSRAVARSDGDDARGASAPLATRDAAADATQPVTPAPALESALAVVAGQRGPASEGTSSSGTSSSGTSSSGTSSSGTSSSGTSSSSPGRPAAAVADDIHDRRTKLDTEPLPEIDTGLNPFAALALFVAGVLVVLVVVSVMNRSPGGARAGVAGAEAVVEANAGDAGAVVAVAGSDAGLLAALSRDAGTTVVVDAGPGAPTPEPATDAAGVTDAGVGADGAPPVADAGDAAAVVVVDAGTGVAVIDAGTLEFASDYDRYLKRAETLARRGDPGRAVRAYKAALALRADSVTAHLGIGEAYYELDNLDAALTHLERARVLAPSDPQVFVLLGAAYQSAERTADAIAAYERYLTLAPEGRMSHDVRAILRSLKN